MANAVRRSIPSALLLLASALMGSPVWAQSAKANSKIEFPIAQKYVKAILAGDLAAMSKLEDDNMKQKMTKEVVTTANQQIHQGVGALKSFGAPRVGKPVQRYDIVYIPCVFEHGKLDLKVVFDASHKVVGCVTAAPGSP